MHLMLIIFFFHSTSCYVSLQKLMLPQKQHRIIIIIFAHIIRTMPCLMMTMIKKIWNFKFAHTSAYAIMLIIKYLTKFSNPPPKLHLNLPSCISSFSPVFVHANVCISGKRRWMCVDQNCRLLCENIKAN